jgi:starch synthase
MPSYFEPCGLGQMIAMRYGSLPVVRATGGLKDTVINNKNGLVFNNYQINDLAKVMQEAVKIYANKTQLKRMIALAMSSDWSWDLSAQKYLKLYNKII